MQEDKMFIGGEKWCKIIKKYDLYLKSGEKWCKITL